MSTIIVPNGVPGISTALGSVDFTNTLMRFGVGTDDEEVVEKKKFITPNGSTVVAYTEPYVPAPNTVYDYIITVQGANTPGDAYRADFFFTTQRIGGAAATFVGAGPVPVNVRGNGAGTGFTASVALTGTNGAVQVSATTGTGGVALTVSFRRVQSSNPGPFQVSWLGTTKVVADFNPIAGQVTVVSGHATSITDAVNGHVLTNTGASPSWFATGGGASGSSPFLRGDGISQALRGAFTLVQPEEIFLVAKWTFTSATCTLFDGATTFNTGRMYAASNTFIHLLSTGASDKSSTYAAGVSGWNVYDASLNGAASYLTIGGDVGSSPSWPQDCGAGNMGGITLFAMGDAGAGSNPASADVARLIICTGLTAGDRSLLLAYLATL